MFGWSPNHTTTPVWRHSFTRILSRSGCTSKKIQEISAVSTLFGRRPFLLQTRTEKSVGGSRATCLRKSSAQISKWASPAWPYRVRIGRTPNGGSMPWRKITRIRNTRRRPSTTAASAVILRRTTDRNSAALLKAFQRNIRTLNGRSDRSRGLLTEAGESDDAAPGRLK